MCFDTVNAWSPYGKSVLRCNASSHSEIINYVVLNADSPVAQCVCYSSVSGLIKLGGCRNRTDGWRSGVRVTAESAVNRSVPRSRPLPSQERGPQQHHRKHNGYGPALSAPHRGLGYLVAQR